jgi:hypothetical protein
MAAPGLPLVPPLDIPALTPSGVLPPYVGTPCISPAMSPYGTTLLKIAQRFASTPDRRTILRGLLNYRQALAGIGLVEGFQWISGSFLEDIETLETRSPRDVDTVFFCRRPAQHQTDALWQAFVIAHMNLFQPSSAKTNFKCDPYFVDLTLSSNYIVDQARFWFGLFSHRRNGLWKGLLQVPLAISQDDADTIQFLNGINQP